jgi:myo-inositol 2-dehydrogenase/D-chiro-inositol 1-dehydrogenase
MKLGILGADEMTLAVARAAAPRHQVVCVCALPDEPAETLAPLHPLASRARFGESWEALLDRSQVDAVVVASSAAPERLTEPLRRLVQLAIPTLVAHPAVESMLVAYELDMIRSESGGVLLPYLAERTHPAIRELAQSVFGTGTSIGRIEQLSFERHLVERSRPIVLAEFARDVDLLRLLCGELNKISALGGSDPEARHAHLVVQLSGPMGILTRWAVLPAQERRHGRLVIQGAAGQAVLEMPMEAGWTLETRIGSDTQRREFDPWDPAAAALAQLERAISGEPVEPTWHDAARCLELTECVERSLARGKTIELHFENYTEQGAFKGTMSALGCGLLMLGLLLLVVAAVVNRGLVGGAVIWGLLALLGTFLALQLLGFLVREKREPRGRESFSGKSGQQETRV